MDSPRPPPCIVELARYHWLMGGTILLATGALHLFVRHLPNVAIGRSGYVITLGLGLLYLLAGTLVWLGTRIGRLLNFICSLAYLTRPRLGLRLWREMESPEFKAHFASPDDRSKPVSRRDAESQSGSGEN